MKYIIQRQRVVLYEVEASSEEEALEKIEKADDLGEYYLEEFDLDEPHPFEIAHTVKAEVRDT